MPGFRTRGAIEPPPDEVPKGMTPKSIVGQKRGVQEQYDGTYANAELSILEEGDEGIVIQYYDVEERRIECVSVNVLEDQPV
jgi:hypothetical protein